MSRKNKLNRFHKKLLKLKKKFNKIHGLADDEEEEVKKEPRVKGILDDSSESD